MKQSVGFIIVAVVLAGCQNSPPANNPFLRTTVPPPGTGQAVAVSAGDPYYPPGAQVPVTGGTAVPAGAPAVMTPAPPPVIAAPPPMPPPQKYTPPPGTVDFFYHQSSTSRTKVVDPRTPGYRPGSTALVRRSHPAGSPGPSAAPQTLMADATAGAKPLASAVAATSVAAADGSDGATQPGNDPRYGATRSVVKTSFRDGPTLNAASNGATAASSGMAPTSKGVTNASRGTGEASTRATAAPVASKRTASPPTDRVAAQSKSGGSNSIRFVEYGGGSSNAADIAGTGTSGASMSATSAKWTRSGVHDSRQQSAGGIVDAVRSESAVPAGEGANNAPMHLASAVGGSGTGGVKARSSGRDLTDDLQPSSGSSYGYGTDYEWLSGRLEYSQAAKRWKLRYIPIDGRTDRFGGSVVLSDSSLLAACKPGEFVSVQGIIAKPPTGTAIFSPLYDLRQLQPLTP